MSMIEYHILLIFFYLLNLVLFYVPALSSPSLLAIHNVSPWILYGGVGLKFGPCHARQIHNFNSRRY